MNINERIREYVNRKNILAGVCNADKLANIEPKKAPFVNVNFEKRIDPKAVMTTARSVIAVGVGYDCLYKPPAEKVGGCIYGKFAIGTLDTDYHTKIRTVLEELRDYLKQYISFEEKILVDNHWLIEREFAKKAGIGWQGKNCSLISDKFGSYFNIGLMLVDIEITPDNGFATDYSECGSCDLCIKACKGKCLADYSLDYTKCASYLSQKKGVLTAQEEDILCGYIYGCDICQKVCRFNQRFSADSSLVEIESFLALSDEEFETLYKKTSAGWRGKETLMRNGRLIRM